MTESLLQIDEFCRLYKSELRGSLDEEDRPRLLELAEKLRGAIDGASGTKARPMDQLSMGGQDAMAEILGQSGMEPEQTKKVDDDDDLLAAMPDLPLGGAVSFDDDAYGDLLDEEFGGRAQAFVDLPEEVAQSVSKKDRGKLRAVRTNLSSGYTPPVQRGYLSDYFGELEPMAVGGTPSRAVRAAGGHLELMPEVAVYFGVQAVDTEPEPDPLANIDFSKPPPAPPPVAAGPAEEPLAPGESPPRPISIYLMTGAVRKGETRKLEPETGFVKYRIVRGMPDTRLPVREVREIHFAPVDGIPPMPATGQRMTITLVNGQRISGFSPDYAPGVTAMHVAPDPRPHNLDFIWLPAWSVKEIQLG